jgi:DNA-directed RNA polymerase specialized sigma subunit
MGWVGILAFVILQHAPQKCENLIKELVKSDADRQFGISALEQTLKLKKAETNQVITLMVKMSPHDAFAAFNTSKWALPGTPMVSEIDREGFPAKLHEDIRNPDTLTVDETVERAEAIRIAVRKIMDFVPDEGNGKRILEYIYFRGMTMSQTAEVLGMPLGTVKSRVNHIFTKVRETFPNLNPGLQ